jgi:hypothetical protein
MKDHKGIQLWLDDEESIVDSAIHNIGVVAPIYVGGIPKTFKPAAAQVVKNYVIIGLRHLDN